MCVRGGGRGGGGAVVFVYIFIYITKKGRKIGGGPYTKLQFCHARHRCKPVHSTKICNQKPGEDEEGLAQATDCLKASTKYASQMLEGVCGGGSRASYR